MSKLVPYRVETEGHDVTDVVWLEPGHFTKTVNMGGRSYKVLGPVTDATVLADAESVGLTPAELDYAAGTEYQQSAVHQIVSAVGEDVFAKWAADDRLEAELDAYTEHRMAAAKELRALMSRYRFALARAGCVQLIREIDKTLVDNLDAEADGDYMDHLAASAQLALFDLGVH
jgi:hypothetical protein